MDPASAHRKIELQSSEDLTYLINNVRRAARERIDEAFPPANRTHGEEDELRSQIEVLVNEFITKTFTLASPSLSINGLPVSSPQFLSTSSPSAATAQSETAYEPFNHKLHDRVFDLARQEEDLLAEIARMKTEIPRAVAAAFADEMKEGITADESALEDRTAAVLAMVGKEEAEGLVVGVHGLERQAEVEEGFRNATQGLGRLKREMPAAVAKMERARVAGEYVFTQGR